MIRVSKKGFFFSVILCVLHISLFGQFDLESMEVKMVKGKVVDPKEKVLSGVAMKKGSRTNLGTTDAKGAFTFTLNVQKGSNKRPKITFSKSGYEPIIWEYDYSTFKTIVMYPIGYHDEVEEPVVAEEVPSPVETVHQKRPEKMAPKPTTLLSEVDADLSKKSEALSFTEIDQKELEELKSYISYLESKLKESGVAFDTEALGQENSYSKEVAQKIETLKEQVSIKEKELEESEGKRKVLLWIVLAIILILIPSILAIVFFINGKKTKKLNVELADKVEEVQQANEEIATQRDDILEKSSKLETAYTNIRASVQYAKRIQESILIRPEEINKHFADAFIYFQPKDIVSGDSYWFSEVDNKLILAAIDCTGHGVPGALMTMLSNSLLNEIVNKNKVLEPHLILKELHQQVRVHLHQEEEDSAQDGMDIALVVIDPTAKTLAFAGANNPFYYIDQDECKQVRGTKSGIGGDVDIIEYSQEIWQLDHLSTFYLFSDGFQDQFGESGKKYMKKNFRDYLFTISAKPMSEQKALLDTEFENWKGTNEQTDDVLVIGVKLG